MKNVIQKVKQKVAPVATKSALALAGLGSSALAFADYNVQEVVDEFDEGEAPVGAVASASLELLVIRRVWKIIRSSI